MKELRGLDLATRSRHELSKAARLLVSIIHTSSGFSMIRQLELVNENETKGFVRVHNTWLNTRMRELASHHKAFLTLQTPAPSPK